MASNAQKIFDVGVDGSVTLLNDKVFGKDETTKKAIAKLGGKSLKELYNSANSGDYTELVKTLVLGAVALVPYGGAFASSVLGIIWPFGTENNKDPLATLKKEIEALQATISATATDTFKAHYVTLLTNLQRFENQLNDKGGSIATYTSHSDDLGQQAVRINEDFRKIIGECSIQTLQTELLPLYTLVAMSHLVFLDFLAHNHDNSGLHIDSQTFKHQLQPDIDHTLSKYRIHIQDTYAVKNTELQNDMANILSYYGISYSDNTPKHVQENLSALKNRRNQLEREFNNTIQNSNGFPVSLPDKLKTIPEDIQKFEKLIDERQKYYEHTLGNPGFRMLVPFNSWQIKNGKWYYYDDAGHVVTGWKNEGTKYVYYLDPKESGAMVTGWKSFNVQELLIISRFSNGKLLIPISKILKNTHSKGDMLHMDLWFYFNKPQGEPGHIEGFSEGASIYDGTHKISGKEYIFDKQGICLNP